MNDFGLEGLKRGHRRSALFANRGKGDGPEESGAAAEAVLEVRLSPC
jgi:hypothetical protein